MVIKRIHFYYPERPCNNKAFFIGKSTANILFQIEFKKYRFVKIAIIIKLLIIKLNDYF